MPNKRKRLEAKALAQIEKTISAIDELKDELRREFTESEAAGKLTREKMRLETKYAVLAVIARLIKNARDVIQG